jgi:hypothetical protein
MMKPKLKIGLLVDSLYVPNWVFQMTERIARSNHAVIDLLIIDDEQGIHHERSEEDRVGLLYRLYARIDESTNRCFPDALERVDLSSKIDPAQIHIQSRNEGSDRWILDDDARKIEEFGLDVLIDVNLHFNHLKDPHLAKYGVWRVQLGDNVNYKGRPPGFWEIYDDNPVTGSNVQVLRDGSEGVVIYQSYSSTDIDSLKRNKNQSYCKCSAFIPRKLQELYERGDVALAPVVSKIAPAPIVRGASSMPSNVDVMSLLLKKFPRGFWKMSNRMVRNEQWAIRYGMGKGPLITCDDFHTLVPPPNTWWADPQVVYLDGMYLVFLEELKLPRRSNKGHISVIRLDSNGNHDPPVKVLERPYHLSYPSVFGADGLFYMVPESVNNHTIELFEAVDFPWKWQFKKNLMKDVIAVDSTMAFKDGLWWLFTNIKENSGASINDELFLFYSEDLLSGDWHPHPLNPVVSDARCARSGGAIFEWEGSLYRPSQDCSRMYGHSVNIRKILKMNEMEYREEGSAYVEPKAGSKVSRIHTYDYCENMTVIDAYMSRSRMELPGKAK